MDFDDMVLRPWSALTPERRREIWATRPSWWSLPAANTLDRATAHLPRLLHERLDEFGHRLRGALPEPRPHHALDPRRRGPPGGVPRAQRVQRRDLLPVRRPHDARGADSDAHARPRRLAELDHAVGELGFKAIMINGIVHRPVGGAPVTIDRSVPNWGSGSGQRLDALGARQRVRLRPGVAALPRARRRAGLAHAGHGLGQPPLDLELHVQPHRLVRREHGSDLQVAVPGRCHAALPDALLRPARGRRRAGRARSTPTCSRTGRSATATRSTTSIPRASTPDCSWSCSRSTATGASAPISPDSRSRSRSSSRSRRRSTSSPPAGSSAPKTCATCSCRASTSAARPTTRWWRGRSAAETNPLGARLRAMFSSDIGHWDVPDMAGILAEAWELVEDGLIGEADFREFVFANPVRFYTSANPRLLPRHALRGGRREARRRGGGLGGWRSRSRAAWRS